MQRYYETVIDTLTGAPVKNAEVWVFNAADSSLATIYTDAAGALPHINLPLLSDDNGFFEFFATDGLYTFEYRAKGTTFRTITNVAIFDLSDMRLDLNDVQARMATAEAAITAANAAIAANTAAIGLKMAKASNLSDLANLGTARTNLSVYSKAEVDAAIAAVSGTVLYYNFGAFAVGSILASEILLDHIVAVANTLAANFANLQVSVGTNPAATWAADVQKNGASIGTISIDNAGVVTKTTVGGTAKALAVGDVVTVIGPAGLDASIARLRFTFRGTI